ncbi:hypothetical protein E3N88_09647 [Mikania micrantha]|uniref:PGG domain-containing protein n=1 Tax=Mikania micrantha TaxID=192012 RepID=A0A5N6PLM5_9ASTR|nr:hypothetical protein E3N88_09647 [Mikania micrantha]
MRMDTKKQIKMECSSSSNPGNPYPYPYPSHVTMKLSGEDTYDVWKTQMLCLFKSHDMLSFIQQNPLREYNYDLWERSEALVKGWILGSLSNETLKYLVNSFPNKDFTAKDAWDKLQTVYGPPVRAVQKLYAAILVQNYWDVKAILKGRIVTLRDRITINGNTALHMAVGMSNNKIFLRRMLNLASEDNQQALDMRNSEGSTLLHVAAIVGNTEAAKILIRRHSCHYMLFEKDNDGQTPLEIAVSNMQTDTSIYLFDHYSVTPDLENGEMFDGTQIVVNTISSKDYDLAYKMRRFIKDPDIVLMAIAQNFPPEVPDFADVLRNTLQAYKNAKLLVHFTCDLIRTSTTMYTTYTNVLFEATRQDAVEVVKEIVSRLPNAIGTINEDGHDIIQLAVINHSSKVYRLLYRMSKLKITNTTIEFPFKNNLLHLAARLAPENKIKHAYGPALQMQLELQWFKEVERFVSPLNVNQKNSFGETPQMVFTNEHKKLRIEGEKWLKETAQSYTIIAALITTIMFAAAITVPGGNKQDSGIPMFTNVNNFTLFAILDGISFVTSATSLIMFLSILTDRFYEQDFLFILPLKLAIGVYSLHKASEELKASEDQQLPKILLCTKDKDKDFRGLSSVKDCS